MGCSTSKNAVENIETNMQKPNSATASNKETMDALEQNSENSSSSNIRYPPAEAFVVPLNDTGDKGDVNDSLPREDSGNIKQLPKRLQQLMTQASSLSSPKKIEDLQEKLERADARRQQFLQQKLDSIQKTTQTIVKNSEPKIEEEVTPVRESNLAKNTNDIITTSLDDDSKNALLNSSKA